MHDEKNNGEKEKSMFDKTGEADIIKLGKPTIVGDKKVRFVRWDSTAREYLFYCNKAGRKLQLITE